MKILPNIILIVLDTAAAKHMSLYGYHRKTTPELEKIAEECVVYTRCFAPATWTGPSHASLFTGLYPTEHGAFYHTRKYLYPFFYTISDVLCSVNYNIYAISANSIISPSTGYLRKCIRFVNIMRPYHGIDLDMTMHFFRGRPFLKKVFRVPLFFLKGGQLRVLFKAILNSHYFNPTLENITASTKKALSFVRKIIKSSNEPYFIFVNIMQPHLAYNPPVPFRHKFIKKNSKLDKRFRKMISYQEYYANKIHLSERDIQYLKGLYDAEILFSDFLIGKLYKELKASGQLDNMVLILTSDHGEQFGEKGRMGHMQSSIYNNLIHIPMIIKYPDWMKTKGVNSNLTQLNDLFSTFAELLDSDLPVPKSSISLLSKNRKYALAQYFFEEEFEKERLLKVNPKFDLNNYNLKISQTAYIKEDLWKLILRNDGKRELYDLNKDFYEEYDLSGDKKYENVLRDITKEALKEIKRVGGEILLNEKTIP